AFRIAAANGLRLDDLIPALEAGSARNFLTWDAQYARDVYAAWSGDKAEFDSINKIGLKDLKLARQLGKELNLPALDALLRVKETVGAETFENWQAVWRGEAD